MKLDTLDKVFAQRSRVKLFVLTEDFCLCGYASRPHATADGRRVFLDSSIRLVFASGALIRERERTGTLFLTGLHKVTRRIQTHRRHLRGRDVPDEYFRCAGDL